MREHLGLGRSFGQLIGLSAKAGAQRFADDRQADGAKDSLIQGGKIANQIANRDKKTPAH
jgi:hypothetical protein